MFPGGPLLVVVTGPGSGAGARQPCPAEPWLGPCRAVARASPCVGVCGAVGACRAVPRAPYGALSVLFPLRGARGAGQASWPRVAAFLRSSSAFSAASISAKTSIGGGAFARKTQVR